ncbi:uncharacterized protein BO88DRAFT_205728 [Aspergillus vadensis CBS 113365]|uniref:Uncharacterized protein n=1 Tax=Aspergillus vadensis (strain CBS 113365 / IMI 142717 / IBT 24658) TaxID=1448311 RepID=A0A319BIF1_ASPVC|nr:hypothetical protein BO88DRAFT_205728 [Aspergillus vadensis CBS 113365]PYH72071.1 hypothetical protein BO88DRAFT_205728 [Aspergillus vadensis CBS 113365]
MGQIILMHFQAYSHTKRNRCKSWLTWCVTWVETSLTRRPPRKKDHNEEHFPICSWAGWICPIQYVSIDTYAFESPWPRGIYTPIKITLIESNGH